MLSTAAVVRLEDPAATDIAVAGGKGANLARLTRAGLPVPAGFVVSTAAYAEFVARHDLQSCVHHEMAYLSRHPAEVDVVSRRLRDAFEAPGLPAELRDEIVNAYHRLGSPAVAVRSSATAEDLPTASFAGQQDTFLDVVGDSALCTAVRRCWSSVWTARAIAYRCDNNIPVDDIAVAVVVQEMIPADVAGVLFTADPVSGRRDQMVVEASAGLGEAVVSGRVTPERTIIDRRTRAVVSGPASTSFLDPADLTAVIDLGVRAADVLDAPQDVEWALADGRSWLLQSRPITSLFPLPAPSTEPGLRVYLPAMVFAQGISSPFTPAGNAFFCRLTGAWIRYLATGVVHADNAAPPWLPVLAGRMFIDITAVLQRPRLASRMIANFRLKEPIGSRALQEWLSANSSRLSRPRRWGVSGVGRWLPELIGNVIIAAVVPARVRPRVLAATDAELARLEHQAAAQASPQDQLDFVFDCLAERICALVIAQLPIAYAEQVVRIVLERLAGRWVRNPSELEPMRRWLPHDPTVKMGAALAEIARGRAESTNPLSPDDPALVQFLAEFGHRAPDREIDVGVPRFADEPDYVVDVIRSYRTSGAAVISRPDTGTRATMQAAEALMVAVRHRRGRVRAAVMRWLITRHLELGGMRERPKFDMVRGIALARRTLARVGAGLVAEGALDDPADVFFAEPAALRAAVRHQPVDLRASAAANRAEYRRELGRRAVPRILLSDGETVYGPSAAADGSKNTLVGTAISPGQFEGVARVLHSPVGAGLRAGEVLVAPSTDPGWTPLFLVAGALIMEVGGVISHGAVVAREYGIPAVAGVPGAVTRLHTGQRIRVDGNNGVVTILD